MVENRESEKVWNFKELNDETRKYMLSEIELDITSDSLYLSKRFTLQGIRIYPELLIAAVKTGNEQSLVQSLKCPEYWSTEKPENKEQVLAEGEFNVFYMRGLALRILTEGGTILEVYRARMVEEERKGEKVNVGDQFTCEEVLDDLRSRTNGVSKMGIYRGPGSTLSLQRVLS